MEMVFNSDGSRRQAICDCVEMLAEAKNIPIYVVVTSIRPNDYVKAYSVSVTDKAVWKHLYDAVKRKKVNFIGPGFDNFEFEVFVPYDLFDIDRRQVTDFQFSDDESVAKVYARIGQRIYAVWKQWREEKYPDLK